MASPVNRWVVRGATDPEEDLLLDEYVPADPDPYGEESDATQRQSVSAPETAQPAPPTGHAPISQRAPTDSPPSLQEFLSAAKPLNPNVSDRQLRRYWALTYSPYLGLHRSDLPTREAFLQAARSANPGVPDWRLKEYWEDVYGVLGAPDKDPGDLKRGFTTAFRQLPQLAHGVEAGIGAVGEKVFGEGGLWTAIKRHGARRYSELEEELAQTAKPTDSVSEAYDRARAGDIGALADWLQYALGYAGGQAVQMLATAGIGGAIGRAALKPAAEKIAGRIVAKEAARLKATQAGAQLAGQELTKQAVSNVAGKIGQLSALGAVATGMEGGEIFGGLVSEAEEEGRSLTGHELARAFGATALAGGLEFAADKIGVDLLLGRHAISRLVSSRVGRSAVSGLAGLTAESATEFSQTLLEELGQGRDPLSPESIRHAIDAAALGGVAGAVMGGTGGLLQRADLQQHTTAPTKEPEEPPPAGAPPGPPPPPPAAAPSGTSGPEAERETAPVEPPDGPRPPLSPQPPVTPQQPAVSGLLPLDIYPILQSQTVDEAIAKTEGLLAQPARPVAPPSSTEPTKPQDTNQTAVTPPAQADQSPDTLVRLEREPVRQPPRQDEPVTAETVREMMRARGLPAEDTPAFQDFLRQTTGKEKLETLSPLELLALADTIRRIAATEWPSQQAAAPSAQLPALERLTESSVEPAVAPAVPEPARPELEDRDIQPAATPEPARTALPEPQPAQRTPPIVQQPEAATPSDARAENVRPLRIAGLSISVKVPAGGTRTGVNRQGTQWFTKTPVHYGYILRKLSGKKGRARIGAFVKPDTPPEYTGPIYVIDQIDPATGQFDEHKVILGASSLQEAEQIYREQYPPDWHGLQSIKAYTVEAFKEWLRAGDPATPASEAPGTRVDVESDTMPLVAKPRHELPFEQNMEMFLRAEKAKADLEIAGIERGGRNFDDQIGAGGTPIVTGWKSLLPDWYRELTTGTPPAIRADRKQTARQKIEAAIEKIIRDEGVDRGAAVEKVKAALLADREFRKTPWGQDLESIIRGEIPSWVSPPEGLERYQPARQQGAPTELEAGPEEPEPDLEPEPLKQTAASSKTATEASLAVANWVRERLRSASPAFTIKEMTDVANEAFGGTQANNAYSPKDLFDAMELGVNLYIANDFHLDRMGEPAGLADTPPIARDSLRLLQQHVLAALPAQQARRTEEQNEFQQFSTPPHLALIMGYVAGITPRDVVLEPSAGLGGLAVFAKRQGATVIVNEYAPRRADLLEASGLFDHVYRENAEQLHNVLPTSVRPTVVMMNPPFSATAGRMQGQRRSANVLQHLSQALHRLEPGGRLVALIGAFRGKTAGAVEDWINLMATRYALRARVIFSGDAYRKYGTTFGTQLLVLDKVAPDGQRPRIISDATVDDELLTLLGEVHGNRTLPVDRPTQQAPDQPGGRNLATSGEGADQPRSAAPPATDMVGGRGRESQDIASIPGAAALGGAIDVRTPSEPGPPRPADREAQRQRGDAERRRSADEGEPGGSRRRGDRSLGEPADRDRSELPASTDHALSLPSPDRLTPTEKVDLPNDGVFEVYTPKKVTVSGGQPHATDLVESAAMAAIDPIAPTYRHSIPQHLIESGKLSVAQMEAIIYAGESHRHTLPDGARRGYFIGDGTGVGKGRIISGILLDNREQGRRKAIWVSAKPSLIDSARRDWSDIDQSADLLFDLGKFSPNEPIAREQGILFTTYSTLASGMTSDRRGHLSRKKDPKTGHEKVSRLDQIVEWVGRDFDGVIAFDEAHLMGNAMDSREGFLGKGASLRGLMGVELQRRLPKARVVYASATGATEVRNLAYADRLGLWGEGTPFADKSVFIGGMESGGLAAMELVAQNLKATGRYIARQLSFRGVTYDRIEHKLTDEQREQYNAMAQAWRTIWRNVTNALHETGAQRNRAAQAHAKGRFVLSVQRFFNQILTAMQMPSVIAAIRADIDAGRAVLIQLVNTNESAQDRAIAQEQLAAAGESRDVDLEAVDLSPREILREYVSKYFPVQQYEEYTDEDGNRRTRPVVDSAGNPVRSAEALRMQQELLDWIDGGGLAVPNGALEQVLDFFGEEQVAEVTGRSSRLIRVRNAEGVVSNRVLQKRTVKAREADAAAFMDDRKRILIFSDAGGTGSSYHADRRAKNQRKRVHYLVQAGWRADNAVQGFGRSHRANQVQPPHYVLVSTDLKGHRRFISSVARRLDQLGALTKGQRQTGGQGIFSAQDNLEGRYANLAVAQLFQDILTGHAPGMVYDELVGDRMAFDNLRDPKTGVLREGVMPSATSFMNRLLLLGIDEQNAVFDAFMDRMQALIDADASRGVLDVGLENYRADRVTLLQEEVAFSKPETGEQVKLLTYEAQHRIDFLPFSEAEQIKKGIGFYVSQKTGKIFLAIRPGTTSTTESGSILENVILYSPIHGKTQHITLPTLERSYVKQETGAARALWERTISETTPYRTERIYLATGSLLSIWDRLPSGHTRIMRVTSDDGRRTIGRLIDPDQIASVRKKLGMEAVSADAKLTPQAAVERLTAIGVGGRIVLANDWFVRLVRVADERRFELRGTNLYQAKQELEKAGLFSERIQFDIRWFLPTDRVVEVLANLTRYRPIVDVVDGGTQVKEELSYEVREGESPSSMYALARQALADLDRAGQAETVPDLPGVDQLRPDEGRTLGIGITRDLINQGVVDLRGRVIRTAEDLAKLAQVYRNPLFETFRFVFVNNDGAIVWHEGVTSRLPGVVMVFTSRGHQHAAIAELADRMAQVGATGYWLLHNHPSGNSEPSDADIETTKIIASKLPGFLGHVVIDSNEYSTILSKNDRFIRATHGLRLFETDPLLIPSLPHPLLGRAIRHHEDVAHIGRQLKTPERWATVLYCSGRNQVRAIQELSTRFLSTLSLAKPYLRKASLAVGGASIFVYHRRSLDDGPDVNLRRAMQSMLETNLIADFVEDNEIRMRSLYREQSEPALRSRGQYVLGEPISTITSARVMAPPSLYGTASVAIPPINKVDHVLRLLADKHIDLVRVVEAVKAAHGELADDLDPVLKEELYLGRLAQRNQDFLVDELRPLLDAMRLHKVSIDALDTYLHARHAKEANAYLKSINPDRPDNAALSGMTDEDAERILAEASPVMARLASRVDAIIARTRELMVDYGLESQARIDQWTARYQHYVPLHREGFEEEMGTGMGRDIRGSSVKSRVGSTRSAINILGNIALERERVLVRGEKMRTVIALAGLLKKYPMPDLATLVKPTTITYHNPLTGLEETMPGDVGGYRMPTIATVQTVVDEETGERVRRVVHRPDPAYKGRDNVVNFRLHGEDHAIVFNEHNPRAVMIARALKDLDVGEMNAVLTAIAPITRYLASINTQYNPVFGVTNFVRDVQFAMLTLQSTPLRGKQVEILRNVRAVMGGIYQDARAIRRGEHPSSVAARLWERFEHVGGPTGYRDLFRTSDERVRAIQHALDPDWWQKTIPGKIATLGGLLGRAESVIVQRALKPIFEWLSDYNLTMENAIRLAVFKAAIDQGMTDERAASLAKNITVNFNRKGQVTAQAGAAYAFFNASVQGTVRMMETLFERGRFGVLSATGKRIVGGGMLLGALQAFGLMLAGMDEDDPPEWLKARSFVIPTMSGGGYVSYPLPLGFNAIPSVGRLMAEALIWGRPLNKAEKALGMLVDIFSPVGGYATLLQAMTPTALDPIVALAENRDWTGRAIYQTDVNPLRPTPGFTRARDVATPWARGLAEVLNYATLGTDYTPGAFSPTPDAIDYLIGQATGGIGREIGRAAQTASAIATGESLPVRKIPLVGRFIGTTTDTATIRDRFYRAILAINLASAELQGLRDARGDVAGYLRAHREAILSGYASTALHHVQQLQRRRRELIRGGAPREQIASIEAQIRALMERVVDRYSKMVTASQTQ